MIVRLILCTPVDSAHVDAVTDTLDTFVKPLIGMQMHANTLPYIGYARCMGSYASLGQATKSGCAAICLPGHAYVLVVIFANVMYEGCFSGKNAAFACWAYKNEIADLLCEHTCLLQCNRALSTTLLGYQHDVMKELC